MAGERPLRLLGTRLYLDRYWREERAVAADLNETDAASPAGSRCRRRPRHRQDDAGWRGSSPSCSSRPPRPAGRPPLIALAAPTGKAAARLQEAVHEETASCRSAPVRELLIGLRASTLHRLLGWRPGSHSRFAHDRGNRLPHDVVIVDETSMVSLSLMARLVEAVRPDARLILVGDPGSSRRSRPASCSATSSARSSGEGIVVLDRVHRYGGGDRRARRCRSARRRRRGSGGAAAAPGRDHVAAGRRRDARPSWRWCASGRWRPGPRCSRAARAGSGAEALAALGRFRLLCAHRRGPYGVSDWTSRVHGVARGRARRPRRRAARLRRAAAAGHRERLRAGPLQRRHRRDRAGRRPGSRAPCSSAGASCCTSARCGSAPSRPCTR